MSPCSSEELIGDNGHRISCPLITKKGPRCSLARPPAPSDRSRPAHPDASSPISSVGHARVFLCNVQAHATPQADKLPLTVLQRYQCRWSRPGCSQQVAAALVSSLRQLHRSHDTQDRTDEASNATFSPLFIGIRRDLFKSEFSS